MESKHQRNMETLKTSLNLKALGEQNMGGKMPNDKMNEENSVNNNEENNTDKYFEKVEDLFQMGKHGRSS